MNLIGMWTNGQYGAGLFLSDFQTTGNKTSKNKLWKYAFSVIYVFI